MAVRRCRIHDILSRVLFWAFSKEAGAYLSGWDRPLEYRWPLMTHALEM